MNGIGESFAQHLFVATRLIAVLCFTTILKYLVDPWCSHTGNRQQFYSRAPAIPSSGKRMTQLLERNRALGVIGYLKNTSPQERYGFVAVSASPRKRCRSYRSKFYGDLEELVKEDHQARQKSGSRFKTMRTSDHSVWP